MSIEVVADIFGVVPGIDVDVSVQGTEDGRGAGFWDRYKEEFLAM